jgi:polysaccharide export outer membrane protein
VKEVRMIARAYSVAALGALMGGVVVAATLVAGCASSPRPVPTGALLAANAGPAQPATPPSYIIQPGDVLIIKFEFHTEHDQEVTVRPDGGLVLPLVGDVKAAGLNPGQLAAELAPRYGRTLRDPKIAVRLKSTTLNRVYVGGEVNKPGFVVYRPGLTAVQALMEAGGPKRTAALDEVVLVKKVDETRYQATTLDVAKIIESGETTDKLLVAPTDVLFVPMTGVGKANVWVTQHLINMNPFRGFFTIPFYP